MQVRQSGRMCAGAQTARPQPRSRLGVTVPASIATGCSQRVPGGPPSGNRSLRTTKLDNEVVTLLTKHGLAQIAGQVLQNGFDDAETLFEISDQDMRDIGLHPHHVKQLRKMIQDLRPHPDRVVRDSGHEVTVFLEQIGLSQYSKVLIEDGFDELDTLLLIEDADMKDLSIVRGHALKLKKCIQNHVLKSAQFDQPRHIQRTSAEILDRMNADPQPQFETSRVRPSRINDAGGRGGIEPNASKQFMSQVPCKQSKSVIATSWDQVQLIGAPKFGELLYKNTFKLAPEALELFPEEVRSRYRHWDDDMAVSGDAAACHALRNLFTKVVQAIGCTVAGLNDYSKLVPMLTSLGARHIHYKVPEAFWPVLGRALDLTMAELLADAYTVEVQTAWTMVYAFVSNIMIEGLHSAKNATSSIGDANSVANGNLSSGASEAGESESPRSRIAPNYGTSY